MKKQILVLGLITLFGCEMPNFTINKKSKYYGTCKIPNYTIEGNKTGIMDLVYNEETEVDKQFDFIDSCESVGGFYVNENDSNGRMCYTCTHGEIWKPK